jgi:ATP-dependent HslUV protease, peptidase subunit HslV
MSTMHGTTIVGVLRDGVLAIGGDGQVTVGNTIVKAGAQKVKRLYKGRVLAGFAGAVSDALTLLERCEEKLEEYNGNLTRAVHHLARDWRTDRVLRRLEAMLLLGDGEQILLVAGSGEVLRPDNDIAGIGSGGPYALAAARALAAHTTLSAAEIVEESLRVAAGICIYTNECRLVEVLERS